MIDLPLSLVLVLCGLAYAAVTSSLLVLAHRSHMRTRRHDLVVQIQTRRLWYEKSLMERQKSLQADYASSDVELVDDEPAVAGRVAPAEDAARQAA